MRHFLACFDFFEGLGAEEGVGVACVAGVLGGGLVSAASMPCEIEETDIPAPGVTAVSAKGRENQRQ